jgi:hypothetical protein
VLNIKLDKEKTVAGSCVEKNLVCALIMEEAAEVVNDGLPVVTKKAKYFFSRALAVMRIHSSFRQ